MNSGKPKAIVHGVGGTLLQHRKEHMLHTDIRPLDRVFFYTTCGWMMWNWLVSALASGATLVLYDGSPTYPGFDAGSVGTPARGVGRIHALMPSGVSSRSTLSHGKYSATRTGSGPSCRTMRE